MKKIASIILVLVMIFAFTGCANKVSKSEAKDQAEAFLEAIEKGDFEQAKTYLHPEKSVDLEKYFNNKELQGGIDFQKGIEITKYTNYSSSLHETEVDGGEYELEMNVTVDGNAIEMSIDVVRNDLGFGIYDFDVDLENLGIDD